MAEVQPKKRAPRRKKPSAQEEVVLVAVGESGTIHGLPTEVLEQIVTMLVRNHPRHALELGLSSKLFAGLVNSSLAWKHIAEAAKIKIPKATKTVPFPFMTAVARNWAKLCWGCYLPSKDKVSVQYGTLDAIMLCTACRVARWDPEDDIEKDKATKPLERLTISKTKAKEQFKLTDRDLAKLDAHGGYRFDEVRQLARKLHGGDEGIRAVVAHTKERRMHLRETREENRKERARLSAENRTKRQEALKAKLAELNLEVAPSNPMAQRFIDGYYGPFGLRKGQVYDAASDPNLKDTVDRIVLWDRLRKERAESLPEELKKHGLEFSPDSMWCEAYIEQTPFNPVQLTMVVKELTELKWFFEKTDFRKLRYGEGKGEDRTYLNDDDTAGSFYSYLGRKPRPLSLLGLRQAQSQIMSKMLDERFAAGNRERITNESDGFADAPQCIIDRFNTMIATRLQPAPILMPFFPFGNLLDAFDGYDSDGGYSDEYSDMGPEDVCSVGSELECAS
ncbi:hypothetical protein DFJ74DRAFT_695389 [Hyaloraphidium curvatum]|nr:hypothetical protein DFJ74DRAFT_695389 [Hyaloraphidium curvatum]